METQIKDLKPGARELDVTFKVLRKSEIRDVADKMNGEQHKVTEAVVGDPTGVIQLTLWDEKIDALEDGKVYKIGNTFINLFKGNMRLNIGRLGTVAAVEGDMVVEETNDMSAKVYEQERRPFHRSGGFGGGGGRREGGRDGGGYGSGGGRREGGGGGYGRSSDRRY